MATRVYAEQLSKIRGKIAAVLDEQVEQLNQAENKLIGVFNNMLQVDADLAVTLKKNSNITLAEWVASYKAKSPIEESIRQLAEVIGENYEGKHEDQYGEWEKVDAVDAVGVKLSVDQDKICANRYATSSGKTSYGYLELADTTVYSYIQTGLWQDRTLTKLENCKLEYRSVPGEEPKCRIVRRS